ncbi:hypothetical protein F5Y12DRAFT_533962 [Xylaria sp. FL1777]|nr:hypothetical protein F5Y12DRAFT_533962 [Xylaria sp. FL1777]
MHNLDRLSRTPENLMSRILLANDRDGLMGLGTDYLSTSRCHCDWDSCRRYNSSCAGSPFRTASYAVVLTVPRARIPPCGTRVTQCTARSEENKTGVIGMEGRTKKIQRSEMISPLHLLWGISLLTSLFLSLRPPASFLPRNVV